MSKFTVLPRAAAVVAALALALPALAQTNQPASNVPAVSTTDKSVTKQTTGEMKSDPSKTHAAKDMKDGNKNADHKQSAQAPASKNAAAPAKSDNKAQ